MMSTIISTNTNMKPYNTYLGQKGYTIPKNEITVEQQKQIRSDLTIQPFVMGSPLNNNQPTFPAYRESGNKFYVPHYYGVQHFGKPTQYKISEGDDIQLEFKGALREYQVPAVESYLNHVKKNVVGGGLLELPCAFGKTILALNIISQLKKKTFIIVHKEFLLNQWVERISEFLPNARIGRIQGQIIDIDGKDIVIGMLQSLSMKEYPASVFESFGFTIIDEVHHISSEVFSNSLFKIVTKYMLGLSATMNRKDGTTHVFKMFLGEVVFKGERDEKRDVTVRAIEYKVNDEEFNETKLDFRGKPAYSTMISKLCEYNRRSEFIIQTLVDFISVENVDKETITAHKAIMDNNNPPCELCCKKENYLVKNTCCDCVKYCLHCMEKIILQNQTLTKKQRPKCPSCTKVLKYEQNYIENPYISPLLDKHVIVMSHNLNVLHYMYKKFVCKNLASVGYYVGGMNESELKKSEKKQVILSTYTMSSEGLDIPTLNTEFLITPKTDIEQSVGRCLRAKHAVSEPIVYDFIDSHDIFKRQWLKRKSYYKKQGYKIILTNSNEYNLNTEKWKIIYQNNKQNSIAKIPICKKNISIKSNSSSDRSIASESDEELDSEKDKLLQGKCFLNFKKSK